MRNTEAEMTMARLWADMLGLPPGNRCAAGEGTLLGEASGAQFSFTYGGQPSAGLLPGWRRTERPWKSGAARTERTVAYTDPATGLAVSVDVTLFSGFPAVEWVLHLENTGAADTPLIENILPLDGEVRSPGGDPRLHFAKGGTCSMEDFRPMARVLNAGTSPRFTPGGGRSSSDFLPFFNVETPAGDGLIVALGWSGEWAAEFRRDKDQGLKIMAGMDVTRLRLHPGERIRTPLMLALFWQGERARGQNVLRRFLLTHHRPRVNGAPFEMPTLNGNWGGTPARRHLANIEAIADHGLPVDYYWIDAEWFGDNPQWWKSTGSWYANKNLYPQGFTPISDAAHAARMKFLLWFEPERVSPGTQWYKDHPQWLLGVPQEKRRYNWGNSQAEPDWVIWESRRNQIVDGDMLLNLAIPEARRFLTDFISDRIREFGLDCYRHDANIAPLEFWRHADSPDRKGMTEIRWVEGLYAFWDGLLERFPHLIIDNCASGGRRIDLETISRSTPFCRTDYAGNVIGRQCHTYGILSWIPFNSTGGLYAGRDNAYEFRSTMSSGIGFGLFGNGDAEQTKGVPTDYPFDDARRMLTQYKGLQKYYRGDYYPLTEYTQAEDAWMAYQLDLPEEGEGIIVVLKRPRSHCTHARFPLKALNEGAAYRVEDLDTGATRLMKGSDLAGPGMDCALSSRPDTAILRYRRE